ncbi:IPT/TIG domain-containing protein [candidate division KSB1 bacterium]|nr:IPT/TIG domain-containing protein [candidate division KSB1 bacterium]
MKIQHLYLTICLIIVALLFGITGCEYDGPAAIWNADADLGVQPSITAIDPPESAGGASVIQIIGQGFKVDSTKVYFDDVPSEIQSMTPTEIIVYRPNISGDSIAILVQVDGAVALAAHSGYEITAVVSNYGKFVTPGGVFLMDFDTEGNMWMLVRKRVFKILPDQYIVEITQQTYRGSTSDIKIGPNGYLFMKKKDHALLYMIDSAQNDTTVEYAAYPKNMSYIDFDENGNIFAGGDGTGIGVIVGDTSYVVGNCEDLSIVCIRVFDDALYVLDDESNVWRSEILDDAGTLADKELFLDWSTSGYTGAEAFCITFDADGILYVGTDHSDTVLMFDTDGKLIGPLFKGILFPSSIWMTWDNDNSLYVTRYGSPEDMVDDLFKVSVDKAGAPYYGRGL